MPVYEYRCEECNETFELFVRSAGKKGKPECPKCGSTEVKKAISLFGLGSTGQSSGTSSGSGIPVPT